MGEVIDILARQPHKQGKVICLACKYTWQGVSPVECTDDFECPKCGIQKGVWANLIFPETLLQCDCGNLHFCVSGTGNIICTYCGLIQTFNSDLAG